MRVLLHSGVCARILDIFAGRYGYLQICTSTSRQGCYFELHLRPVLRPALAANSSESQSVTCGFLLSESKSSVVPKTDQKGSGPRIKQARTTRTPRLSVRRRLALTSMTAMRGARAPHPSASRRPGPVAPARKREFGTGAFKPADRHAALEPARSNRPCTKRPRAQSAEP